MHQSNENSFHQQIVAILEDCGVSYRLHTHEATRTVEDAEKNLSFDVNRIVKTVAFQTRSGSVVLAVLRGLLRVDYARLASLAGVNRRDLAALSLEQVREKTGVEPGSVSPLSLLAEAQLLIDDDVLKIRPTLYCGSGRPDRTIEIKAADLVRISGGRLGAFSRKG